MSRTCLEIKKNVFFFCPMTVLGLFQNLGTLGNISNFFMHIFCMSKIGIHTKFDEKSSKIDTHTYMSLLYNTVITIITVMKIITATPFQFWHTHVCHYFIIYYSIQAYNTVITIIVLKMISDFLQIQATSSRFFSFFGNFDIMAWPRPLIWGTTPVFYIIRCWRPGL